MNVYVHFPFCRSKCAYCALPSRAGSSAAARRAYVLRRAAEIDALPATPPGESTTAYLGGGSPALCDLAPVLAALRRRFARLDELTVELNPRDATPAVLAALRAGSVNRVSLGVQSLDDAALAGMGRRHTAAAARAAFRAVRAAGFANAGLDLIAGWPGVSDAAWRRTLADALALAPDHLSVYTLIREPDTPLDRAVREGRVTLPDDDAALAQIDLARAALADAGLRRYEISSYARPGFECRHNLAVWRGEDYHGLGEGAHGRLGRRRTVGLRDGRYDETRLAAGADALERAVFALRLAEGIDLAAVARRWPVLAPRLPRWRETLAALVPHGLVRAPAPGRFALTARGCEVCDSVIAALA